MKRVFLDFIGPSCHNCLMTRVARRFNANIISGNPMSNPVINSASNPGFIQYKSHSFHTSTFKQFQQSRYPHQRKKSYYEILNCNPSSTKKEIKTSFYDLSRKFHPDVNKSSGQDSSSKFVEISIAYSILSNDLKRKEYDLSQGLSSSQHQNRGRGSGFKYLAHSSHNINPDDWIQYKKSSGYPSSTSSAYNRTAYNYKRTASNSNANPWTASEDSSRSSWRGYQEEKEHERQKQKMKADLKQRMADELHGKKMVTRVILLLLLLLVLPDVLHV